MLGYGRCSKARQTGRQKLRKQVADFFFKRVPDRALRNFADFMGHEELRPKQIVESVKDVYPLTGVVSIPQFLSAWDRVIEQEKSDIESDASIREYERQRKESRGHHPVE